MKAYSKDHGYLVRQFVEGRLISHEWFANLRDATRWYYSIENDQPNSYKYLFKVFWDYYSHKWRVKTCIRTTDPKTAKRYRVLAS